MNGYDGAELHYSKRIGNVMGTKAWSSLGFPAQERFRDDVEQSKGQFSNLSPESQGFIDRAEKELAESVTTAAQ